MSELSLAREVVTIANLRVSAYTVPTDGAESDGTLAWDSTTMVLVEIDAAGKTGIGYTYADISAALLIEKKLKKLVLGQNAMNLPSIWKRLAGEIRNDGNCGIAFMAISAIDTALWDLKAKLLELPLCTLLGTVRDEIQVYGSGGFTSYPMEKLKDQVGRWAKEGFRQVKIKIGRHPAEDLLRVKAAKESIGQEVTLMVDANGAYDARTALEQAEAFTEYGVGWFEEPVSSDNLAGLRFIRERGPLGINIVAGEYGYSQSYFSNMLQQQAVDILQADATRCGGITGFLKAGYLAEAYHIPFSSHCAPALHLHAAMCLNAFTIGEYFYDHYRIEHMFFSELNKPIDGKIKPDTTRPGLGLEFKAPDAAKYKV